MMLKRICLVATLVVSLASQADENFVKNGDFSNGNGNWKKTEWAANPGEFTIDADTFHTGASSLEFQNKSTTNSTMFQQEIRLKPDKKYKLTFWMKGENIVLSTQKGSGAKAFILNKGKFVIEGGPAGVWQGSSGTFDWTKTELEFNTNNINNPLMLYLCLGSASGSAWFDDIAIEESGKNESGELMTGEIFPVDYQKGIYHINNNFPSVLVFKFKGIASKLKNPALVLEMPEEYSCLGACPWLPTSMENNERKWSMEKQRVKEIKRDGRKYKRYTVNISESIIKQLKPDTVAWGNRERVYIKSISDVPQGTKSTVYWKLVADKWQGTEKKFELHALSKLEMAASRVQNFGMMICYLDNLTLPENEIKNAYTDYWKSLSKNSYTLQIFGWNEVNPALRKIVTDNFHTIYMLASRHGGTPNLNILKWLNEEKEKNSIFKPQLMIHSDGKIEQTILCPGFIAKNKSFWNDFVAGEIKKNISLNTKPAGIMYDIEPGAMNYCFCDNCLSDFRNFAGLNATANPEEIRKKYSAEWFNFRVRQNADIIRMFSECVKKNFHGIPACVCTDPLHANGEMIQQWCGVDVRLSDKDADLFFNMPYYSGINYFNDTELNNKTLKTPNFPLNDPSEQDERFFLRYTPEKIRQNIVASAALGCKGFGIWPNDVLDGAYLTEIKSAYSIIGKAEDYYSSTQNDTLIKVKPENVFEKKIKDEKREFLLSFPDFSETLKWTVHKKNDNYLISIFNYNENNDAIVSLLIPDINEKNYSVRDVETGKVYCKDKEIPVNEIDIKNGIPVEIQKNKLKVIEIYRGDSQKITSSNSININELRNRLAECKKRFAESDRFAELKENFSEISWGMPKNENTPCLKLSSEKRKIYINIENGGKIISWQNKNNNIHDILFFKTRGFLDDLILSDDTIGKGGYPFSLEKIFIEKETPKAILSYTVPSQLNANPDAVSLEGLEIKKEISIPKGGDEIAVKYTFTNKNLMKKDLLSGFRIKNYPRLGGAFAGTAPLSQITRISFETNEGIKTIASGAENNNFILANNSLMINFLKLTPKPYNWTGSPIQIRVKDGKRKEQLLFNPDKAYTSGFYVWWSELAGYTVELISKERIIKYGASFVYEYSISWTN